MAKKIGEKDYTALYKRYPDLAKLYDGGYPELGLKEGLAAVRLFTSATVTSNEEQDATGATIRRTEVSYDLVPAPKNENDWTVEYFHRKATDALPQSIEETIVDGQRRALVLTRNDGTRHIRNFDAQGEISSYILQPTKNYASDSTYIANIVEQDGKHVRVMRVQATDCHDIQYKTNAEGLIVDLTTTDTKKGISEQYFIDQGYLQKSVVRAPNGDETHYDYGDKNTETHDRYFRQPKTKTRYWADFNSAETRQSMTGLDALKAHEFLHYFPQLNVANNDIVGKSIDFQLVAGEAEGHAGHYTRTTEFKSYDSDYRFRELAHKDFLPQKMQETIIDGVCRERTTTMINGAVCVQKFGPDSKLHAENGDAAMVLTHAKGKLVEFYENGKPHCLHGACKRGTDIEGNAVAEFAIHGVEVDKDRFYAHPLVQEACSIGGRMSRWFNRITGNVTAVDLAGIAGAAIASDTRVSRVQTLFSTLTPDMRREVLMHLGNSYPDHAPAGFEAWRDRNIHAQAVARVAGDDVMYAVGRVHGAAQEIKKFAADFTNPMMRGMMETLAAEVSLLKTTHEDAIMHARGETAAQKAFAAEKSRVIDEVAKILQQGVSPIPLADEMQAVIKAVSKGYDELPLPAGAEVALYQSAVRAIDEKLSTVREGFQADLGMVARTADTLSRFLSMQDAGAVSLASIDTRPQVETSGATPLPQVLKVTPSR